MATNNSGPRAHRRHLPAEVAFGLMLFLALAVPHCFSAEESGTNQLAFLLRAEQAHAQALKRWQQDSNNVEATWQFGRACFDVADVATNNAQRAKLAEQGMGVCRHAIGLDPKSGPAHYYLGLNIGQLARTRLLTALVLVNQLEAALKDAVALGPSFDFAGPHRSLGVLYRDAPGWPTSVGSRPKARQHLDKAVELFPDYPGNRLALLEAWLEWGEKKNVQYQLRTAEESLKSARTKFSGADWVSSWIEWDQRWQVIKAKAEVEPARSPRGKE